MDDGAAGDVDQQRALFHESDFLGTDEASGLAGEGDDEDDDVRGGQELVQIADGGDACAAVRAMRSMMTPKGWRRASMALPMSP